jgi:lipoprotein-releasing system permease protein
MMMRLSIYLVLLVACGSKESPTPTPMAPPPAAPVAQPAPDAAPDAVPVANWANDPPEVLRDKILAINGHIIVLKLPSFAEWRDVLATIEKTAGVVAAEPFIFAELQIAKTGGAPIPFAIKGVDPKRVERVLGIGKRMTAGTLAVLGDAKPTIVLGDVLATKLGVKLGDEVTVSQPENPTPDHARDAPAKKPGVFRVGGMFHMSFDEYDEKLALVPLAPLQAMMDRGDQVMGIEMAVSDLAKSGELAKAIEDKLGGPPYQAMDWYDLNKQLFVQLFGSRRP